MLLTVNNITTALEKFNDYSKKLFALAYQDLLSQEQITYMNDLFFSVKSLENMIKEGYHFAYLMLEEKVGFIAYKINDEYLFLSKLYLDKNYQGRHLATKTIDYLKQFKLPIKLTVNKHNLHAITVYKKLGFEIVDSVVTSIGNGYVMDDYIMILKNGL